MKHRSYTTDFIPLLLENIVTYKYQQILTLSLKYRHFVIYSVVSVGTAQVGSEITYRQLYVCIKEIMV